MDTSQPPLIVQTDSDNNKREPFIVPAQKASDRQIMLETHL